MEKLGKEGAMAAAVTLQRDAGVMLSNLQTLFQFDMALNRMSFSMMALGLVRSLFPRAEVDALAPAPRAHRAASYMSAMGLWHPQRNPTVPGSCSSLVMPLVYELQILLSGGPAPSGVNIILLGLMLGHTSDFDMNFIGSQTQNFVIMLRHC